MNSVDKFNALDGKDISRPDLYELLQLAKSEEQTHLVQRIKKVLDAYPTAESFTINLSHKESEVVPRSYLAGVDLYTPEEDESDPELALGKPVSTKEIYKMVTDHIIEMMKDATGDNVTQEWKSDKLYCMPINFDSKKPYGGINVFFIHAQQKKMTGDMVFTNPYFLTFKQVEAHKGKVKKGAVAFKVIYYTELHVYKDNDNPKNNFESYSKEKVVAHLKELGYTDDNLPLISYIPMPKYYNVFNGADIEGIDFGLDEVIIGKMTPEDAEENPAAKLIVKHYPNPPKIEHTDPNEAYYDPQEDVVNVPPFERFIGANAYYRTLFHELTHSTGVKKRLDRVLNTKFGSKEYAFEELIAEFGSVFLSAQAGIMWKTSRNHAEYLKNWAIVLEETEKDNKFMMRASAAAQKAANYILALNSEGEPAFWAELGTPPTPQTSNPTPQPTNFLAKIAKKYPTIPQKEINALFALTKYLKEKAPKKIEKIHPTIHNATLAKLDPEGVFDVTDHKNYWNDTIVFNVSAKGIKHTIELTDLGFKMYIDMINHLNGHPFEEEIHKGIADQLADETIQEIIKSKEDDDFLIGTRKKQRTEATEEKQLPKNTEDWDNYILDRAKKLKIDLSQYPVEKQNNIKYVISTTYYKKWEAFYEKWAKKVKCQPEHIRALMFGSGLAGQPWLVEKDETFYLDDIYIIPAFHLEDLGLAIKKGRSYIFSEIGLEIVHDLQKTRGVTKNYEEYVTDKSAEMKAKGYKWSTVKGDWVKTSNILTKDKLNRMLGNKKKQTALAAPHLAVSTDRFKEMSRRELRVYTLEYYNKYLKGHKALIKKALKEVVLTSAAGRKIARGEAMYAAKVAAVEHLKELIENSTYNNWGDRKTTDGKDVIGYMNFKSKLTIDGEKRHVRISLAVYKDRKTELKNMEVGRKEKKTSQPTQNPVGTLQDEEVETSSGRKGTTKKLSTKEKTKKVSKTAPIRPSDNIRLAAPEIPNEEESRDIYVEDLPIDGPMPYLDLSYTYNTSKDGRTTLADRLNAAPSHREMYHIDRYDMAHFLGNLERKTTDSLVITMTGGQGSGKTRFAFQFIDDLAQRYRVGHVSIEETPDSLLYEQKALQYLNDRAVHNVEAADVRSIAELDALIKRNDVIVIDSYQKLKEIDPKFEIDKDLRKKYNGKLFLVIFQQTVDGKMRGGSKSQYDGDIILFTQKFPDYRDNYVYPDKNRYNSVPASLLRYNIAEKALIPVEAEDEPTQTNVYNLY